MMTSRQKIVRTIAYLLELEDFFYNIRPIDKITEKEKILGDEVHSETQKILKLFKTRAIEKCIEELENEQNEK